MAPTITVVTAWHNHRELERDYWAAVNAAGCRVLIVDNASDPPLPNAWRLERNVGFSPANNVGLQLARTDAVLFLNNDVYAVASDWLAPIVAALEPGVLVGANLRSDQHSQVDGIPLPYLDGWCLAGMRADLLELGGWDESFDEPSYYGDNDLCFRARAAGMTLREAPAGIRHKLNQTAGHTDHVAKVTAANYQRFAARVRETLAAAA